MNPIFENQLLQTRRNFFGDSKPPADADPVELAAWALVANLILNLDEAIMRN